MTGQQSRPGADPRPARVAHADASPTVPRRGRLRAACRVRVSLFGLADADLARKVQGVADAPPGALVTLVIEPGVLPPVVALDYLARYGTHLGLVTFESPDPVTARAWWDALNSPVSPW